MHKVISLYTGAGGLDLGLEAAGFCTTVAVEYDATACRTLLCNQSKTRPWNVVNKSIHDVSSEEIMKIGGLKKGEAALLVGGPPCQPFSKSAFWARGDIRGLDDPRADTLSAYLRVLKDTQPKAFLLENVFGLTYKGKDEALSLLQNTVQKINREQGLNYSFEWRILNTADYGVPQIRERFFLIGIRDGLKFKFPEPTHIRVNQSQKCTQPQNKNQGNLFIDGRKESRPQWTTAWDAIGDLNDVIHENLNVTGKWADLLPSIPEGANYLHHTERGNGSRLFGWRTRYWSFLLKLAKNRPSWTIQAQPGAGIGPFHWTNRRLSVHELKRIQTFPDNYKIEGGYTAAQRQLGNAVPSLMAETLGRELMKQVFSVSVNIKKRRLCLKNSNKTPTETPTKRVPKKYLSLKSSPSPNKGHSGREQPCPK